MATRTRVHGQPKVAELHTERKQVRDLKPHPKNKQIRKHPEPGTAEWETLKKSLQHDYFDPLVWNQRNGYLVSGHLRRKVFMEMGIEEADVVVVDYDDATHMARMLAANKSAGNDDILGVQDFLKELNGVADFELAVTGFTMPEIDFVLSYDPESDDDNEDESETDPPEEFPEYDENLQTENVCPSCGYEWSGNAHRRPRQGDGVE